MKKWLVCLCFIMLALTVTACATPANPTTAPEAEVVGVINGENVYRYEYDYYFNMYFNEYFSNYYDTLKLYQGIDLLDEESSRELLGNLEDFAWQSSMQATLIRQMAQQDYDLSLEPNYTDTLLSPAYHLAISTNRLYALLYPIIQEEAQAAKQVTDAEAQQAYDTDPAAWDCNQVAHIIVTAQQMKDEATANGQELDDEAAQAAAKARTEDIIAQLNNGADFADMAAKYSGDGTAQTGGVMDLYFNINGGGISESTSFDPAFAVAAFQLANIGDYSAQPVESSFGYHIIKLLDKKEGFSAVKEYVLKSLQTVSDEDVNNFVQQKLTEKEEAATIERSLEFKYYVEPTEEGEDAAGAEGAEQPAQ